MSGLSFSQAVAQALWQDKLFHIDLNAQRIGKFDQDFRFGSEGIRDAFYVVKLLEDAGWEGMRHFDAHPYRTEDADGVWDFARGCMRTYLILADKARRFHEDPEIQEALRAAKVAELAEPTAPRRRPRRDPRRRPTTRTRWRRRATDTSGWTSSSPNCSSGPASAPRGRGRLVHVGLQGPGARRRHRRRRGLRPRRPPRRPPHRAASSIRGTGRQRSTRPAPRPAFPAHAAGGHCRSPRSSTGWSSSATTARSCGRPSCGTTPSPHPTPACSWRAAGGPAGLGRGVRQRPPSQLHHHEVALAAPLRARDLAPDGRRHAAARLAHLPPHRPADHRPGRRLGHGLLVARVSPAIASTSWSWSATRWTGSAPPRGAGSRRRRRGMGGDGLRRGARARATTWRPPWASAFGRATWH